MEVFMLSVKEAAKAAGIHWRTLYRLIRRGEVAVKRRRVGVFGRAIGIEPDQIERIKELGKERKRA
jgi:excisionase family DNA binding protein